MELSALKPCLARLARESDCNVTDHGSHVTRVVTHNSLSSPQHSSITLDTEQSHMIMQACYGQLCISLGKTGRSIEMDMAKT